jgi:transposase
MAVSDVARGAAIALSMEAAMDAIVERCCALDVGQATLTACLLAGPSNRKPRKEVRTFSTVTSELLELKDWLASEGCTHVVMESTGVYWEPVYNILEGKFVLVVGNAHHIKNVPGRKTDVKDSEWLAHLGRHGLIRPGFVPPRPFRELRVVTRYRRKIVENRSAERNRLLKLLETANIKLASVASNVFGKSGMLMLRAIVGGESDTAVLAEHAKGLLRRKLPALRLALDGRVTDHHRFVLRRQLERLRLLDEDIAELDQEIDRRLARYEQQRQLLVTIPGVDRVLAAVILAELGVDLTSFPTVQRLAAWAGICPGNNESAGRRFTTKTRHGNVALRTALVEAAHGASRTKGSYLRSKYYRIAARRGRKRALVAVGHKILTAVYHMLKTGKAFTDLGDTYLDQIAETRIRRDLVRRLERLGYEVTATKKVA